MCKTKIIPITKTKTITLEVPEGWDFDEAVVAEPFNANGKCIMVTLKRKTTWHWCESPTDEMAKERPDCECRLFSHHIWDTGHKLLGVVDGSENRFATSAHQNIYAWNECRVRIDDATGKVIVRWDDGQ